MKKTPALIFDFGNVVAHFDYARAADTLGAPLGISGVELLGRARAAGFDELVKVYERGEMSATDFSTRTMGLVGLDLTHEAFAAAWADIFRPNAPVVELLPGLKRAGYTLVLGSNTNDLHAAQFRAQFADALAPFDAMVLSYQIGHIKPSVGFYRACAEAAGVAPGDCVFIDDLAENVAGARAAGLRGITYRADDHPGLPRMLRAEGVEVPG